MTTPVAEPAKPTRDLVADVLAEMAAIGEGGGDAAIDKLAARAKAAGKPTAASRPTHVGSPAPPPTKSAGLSGMDREIIRPNGAVYHVRRMVTHDDVEVLRRARDNDLPVLLFGIPGTGKTAMFEAAFTSVGFELVPGTGDTEVSDFVGGYVPLPGGGFMWVDGPLPRAMELGIPLLVDEIALIDPRVMAVAYSVMDGRGKLKITANPERGEVEAKPGFIIFGACNPRAPGARMSEALLSRFPLHVEVGVDFQLMKKMGVPTAFVTCAQNLKKKYDANEISWFPSIREMLDFKRLSELFGENIALANVVSQSPEMDRPQIADVLTRGYGTPIRGLEIR